MLAILLAEQRHRARAQGLLDVHHIGMNLDVGDDFLVHQALHLSEFSGVERGIMSEVEAQTIGVHHAAGLLNVRAQHVAQRRVKQVRRGVIPHGGFA